ncbi:glycoside hydrolase family 3 C-terminal domain-containing protein [Pseudonocardia broussonetiae]|uniref:Exo-alpha-(1->6)-L-arabinopyranosidase n=1 Tax=Pseudonocardia broussonetiae TaxID=2736640 RepID=A0A6M6JMS2_9PSEU|nr:glycoside hydrolase family 3 C-terminal domain-containing protein [Pseudonocardia broussonetiae]QJY48257.1 beta-glucosidase [Pseudonocardia broussonetiae]
MEPLTVEQKAALSIGADFWHTSAVPGVPSILVSDGPHGLRVQPGAGDHVGLGGSLPATCFPTAAALASTWDPALLREVGEALGTEARAQGVGVVLGPGVNIKRSPLCGRNFEYFSEDPHLTGVLAAALVEGVQSRGVGTSLKHFAANNQETDRLRVSAEVDERTLREIYLPAFEHVVTTARPWTVMCAYNRVNGTYASEHAWLLTTVLRDEWGFDGVVVSDWGAVADRVAALAAGLDLEMPPNTGVSDRAIVDAVADGSLDEAVLDRAVDRMRRLVERAGPAGRGEFDHDAHHALARRAAADAIVLLRNEGPDEHSGTLPLRDSPALTVAVVGELARTPRYQGAGSSQVNPTRVDVPLEEIRAALPSSTVGFAPGYALDGPADRALADEAVALASGADVVVAVLGLPPAEESEGFDRTHIDLPVAQTALLARLSATGVPVVVALAHGGVVRTDPWEQRVAAVVTCWLGGQAGGGALADVLTGATDPGGRLAETVPLRLADTPSHLNFPGEEGRVRYGEGVFVGYRGFDALDRPVAHPFGHGLSYTTFGYSGLTVDVDGTDLTVGATVTNTGERAGREVVQLYVGDPQASVARPPAELRGFTKIALEPGESRTVTFDLHARDLSFWSVAHGGWVVEPGEFEIAVGSSSRDLRLCRTVTVDVERPRPVLTADSTLQEWLADPEGGPALRAAAGPGILDDAELQKVIGNFPLARLAAFPGIGITRETLTRLGA